MANTSFSPFQEVFKERTSDTLMFANALKQTFSNLLRNKLLSHIGKDRFNKQAYKSSNDRLGNSKMGQIEERGIEKGKNEGHIRRIQPNPKLH